MTPTGQTPSHHVPSAARVFGIAELTFAIGNSATLGRGDIVRLSQACRCTFNSLVPVIWQSVIGVEILLRLISHTSLVYDKSTAELTHVVLRQHPNSKQFERFDIYAPWVSLLSVYDPERVPFKILGWPLLHLRAQCHLLFPGLKILQVMCGDFPGRPSDTPTWLRILDLSNVNVVSVGPYGTTLIPKAQASLTPESHSRILETLADRCPQIRELHLSPRDRATESFTPQSTLTNSPVPWYNHLNRLAMLQHVSVADGCVTYQSLVALGQLPMLIYLDLYLDLFEGLRIPPNRDQGFQSSYSPFRTLIRLRLMCVSSPRILDILNVPGLLDNVISVTVVQWADDVDDTDWFKDSFLPVLCRKATRMCYLRINDLSSRFSSQSYPVRNIGVPAIMDTMAQLPLHSIDFDRMTLGICPLSVDLGLVWSQLVTLTLPSQHASLQELSCFAAIPKLAYLRVQLDLTTMHTPKPIPRSRQAPLLLLLGSPGAKLPKSFKVMMHNIQMLYTLWSSMEGVRWSVADKQDPLFKNLSRCFKKLVSLYRTTRYYSWEGYQGVDKENKLAGLRADRARLRKHVNAGEDPCAPGESHESDESDGELDFGTVH